MASIDENVEVGLELVTTAGRLTARTIIEIMSLFLGSNDRDQHYQEFKTEKGKQNLKDLFTKYENTGVQALPENISLEEKKEIEKELKSMGVDFSIKKIDKDEYSLFFASNDIESIEKGMQNAISKYNKKQEKKQERKEKPIFNVKDLFERNKEKKQEEKERSKSKEKVNDRDKTRTI